MHSVFSQSTGRVVINEYMPWTSNGCGTTSEFIELLNFGPGPVDIGCYVITTGQYSITIPPNTFLQPGDFYILAGQDFISRDCANIDSFATGVSADLNWNSCRCTNAPIPTTGDGLMTDGGSGNTPIVLFDPSLNVIDAVVRSLPGEPSKLLTTSSVGRACRNLSFDLDLMPITYEELGMSAGRANSFARTTDGDCGWVKDPKQSANASNNRGGDATDIIYNFSVINAASCDSTGGKVSIYVEHADYNSIFPMNYTLAKDIDGDGAFGMNDEYVTYEDNSPPEVEVTGLPVGHYKITIASVKGCYLKTFEFSIFACQAVLPVSLEYFKYTGERNNRPQLEWKMQGVESLKTVIVQKADKNNEFITDQIFHEPSGSWGSKLYTTAIQANTSFRYYRLKIISRNGKETYSPVVNVATSATLNKVWPNPAANTLNLELTTPSTKNITYKVFNEIGKSMQEGIVKLKAGQNISSLSLMNLPAGVYQLQLDSFTESNQPISFRFVKH